MASNSQRFCTECGAQITAQNTSAEVVRFCGTCGKTQYSLPQDVVVPPTTVYSAPQTKKQGMVMMGAVALSLAIGSASYGTTRLFVEKPITKPTNAEIGQAGQNQAGRQTPAEAIPISPETQQAIARLQDSLTAQPNNSKILLRLANAWYDAGSSYQQQNAVFLARQAFGQAEKLYERFLKEFEPKNVAARIDYAYTLLSQDRADDAVAETKKALEFEPNHAIALYNLGVIYNRKGDVVESKKYFNAAVKAAPDSEVAKAATELLKQLEGGTQSGL